MSNLSDFRAQRVNANKHTERGIKALDNSISKDGWIGAVTVAADGETFDGSARLEALADAMPSAEPIVIESDGTRPVIVKRTDIPDTDDPRAKRLGVAANVIAHMDYAPDGEILAMIAADDDAVARLIKQDELSADAVAVALADGLLGDADAEPQIDRAAELNEKWQVQRGDLWRIGGHRLLCGDSTKREDVERVMQGDRAYLLCTDPPYGVDFEGAKYNPRAKEWAGIEGDKRQGAELMEWLSGLLSLWLEYCHDELAVYLWAGAMQEGAAAAAAAAAAGIHVQSQIIWNKNTLVLGQADYQWKHENCWYGFLKGKHHRWFGERSQTTVWDIDKVANASYLHPMQKPTELYARAIRNHTQEGEACAEPFAGSGTQLVSCQNLQRKCRAIEISPNYCAVILERMATAFPGIEIERVSNGTA